jgi:hypothetical protein
MYALIYGCDTNVKTYMQPKKQVNVFEYSFFIT